jgi:hypothetical protein
MYGHNNPTVRSTDDGELVGPRMHKAIELLAQVGPYQSRNALATTVGPRGSQDYGYRIVGRCRRKGLLAVDADHPNANPHGAGAVVLTDKGRRYLDSNSDLDVAVIEAVTVEA